MNSDWKKLALFPSGYPERYTSNNPAIINSKDSCDFRNDAVKIGVNPEIDSPRAD